MAYHRNPYLLSYVDPTVSENTCRRARQDALCVRIRIIRRLVFFTGLAKRNKLGENPTEWLVDDYLDVSSGARYSGGCRFSGYIEIGLRLEGFLVVLRCRCCCCLDD